MNKIKNIDSSNTTEEMKELIVEYGYNLEIIIEKEQKENQKNFIKIEDTIKEEYKKDKRIFILGKLGELLQNMDIKVIIDKRNIDNENSFFINQIIVSGILQQNKYEIHLEEEIDNNNNIGIINNEDKYQDKFIEFWKEIISEYTEIDKNDIYITNIRKNQKIMDTIFKKEKNKNGQNINISEKMRNLANCDDKRVKIKSIYEKNILGICKLSLDMLDNRGNRNPPDSWPPNPEKRGKFTYFPPDNNWIGFGLKVLGRYDNGNDNWIKMNGNENEWAIAYHGTSENAVKPICRKNGKFYSTRKEGGTRQKCEKLKNINKYSNQKYPKCGEGSYCSPKFKYAAQYYKGVIIMCRVNPNLIRIPEKFSKNEWITDGTRNSIRPYRLLYKYK